MGDVVSPRHVTYNGTCHQWLTIGAWASRIFPTTCVHKCRVAQVSAQSDSGRSGHSPGVVLAICCAMSAPLLSDRIRFRCKWEAKPFRPPRRSEIPHAFSKLTPHDVGGRPKPQRHRDKRAVEIGLVDPVFFCRRHGRPWHVAKSPLRPVWYATAVWLQSNYRAFALASERVAPD